MKVLILGGTSEANTLAPALAVRNIPAVYSYAGRVSNPKPQPVPVRTGGFGGTQGLADFLRRENITHLVDATHPFAQQMSLNAVAAAAEIGTPLLALTRSAWKPEPGDQWQRMPTMEAAVASLRGKQQRVMLAIGRMHLDEFAAQPQHHYLLRLVDQPLEPLPLPHRTIVVDRGPFTVEEDRALLQRHRIELVVSKNAGGEGAAAKLVAARELGIPVLMIDRPLLPPRDEVHHVERVLQWLGHDTDLGV
ncbi:cobalt-precorrin-6A reductase [Marinobacter subterrani]|uniref:cobalt-precorrin-6A reductase n=1 Tax=Marinobacter subterrani TaxID=1658765 RepID=UPI0023562DC8|nr:cobalt-precorrin-6A reductase [Marinobacter subterrani]